MTQINVSKDAKKTAGNNNEKPQKHGTQRSWMLLIIGACILITTYCLITVFDTYDANDNYDVNDTYDINGNEIEERFEPNPILQAAPREPMFLMRCINLNSTDTDTENPPSSNFPGSIISTQNSNSISTDLFNDRPGKYRMISIDELEYFYLKPPGHEIELHLFDNRSAQIIVTDFHPDSPINIIWFSDEMESFNVSHAGETIDYNCDSYEEPFLLVENLAPNTTYTFCLLPHLEVTISPFNCLPLYVPPAEFDQDIWIAQEEKQLTICLLCLVFAMSTLVGAGSAYWVIRNYPELLEGSKNVLVVKESDRTVQVSKISKDDHLQNSSIQKSTKVVRKKKDSIIVSPYIPLSNLCSSASSSTSLDGWEQPSASSLPQNEYETPKLYEKSHDCTEYCTPKDYAPSSAPPPPLPRRNHSA